MITSVIKIYIFRRLKLCLATEIHVFEWHNITCISDIEFTTLCNRNCLRLRHIPVNTKHLYNICTMLGQRRRRWAGVVQMLFKAFVSAGMPTCIQAHNFFTHLKLLRLAHLTNSFN